MIDTPTVILGLLTMSVCFFGVTKLAQWLYNISIDNEGEWWAGIPLFLGTLPLIVCMYLAAIALPFNFWAMVFSLMQGT